MNDKDKSEKIFDPTTKLKDEILENDQKYLINSRVIPFNGAFEPGYIHIKKEESNE